MLLSPAALRRAARHVPALRLGLGSWFLFAFLLVIMPLMSGANTVYRRAVSQRFALAEQETEGLARAAGLSLDNLLIGTDATVAALASAFGSEAVLDQGSAGPYLLAVSRGAHVAPGEVDARYGFRLLDERGRVIAAPDGAELGTDLSAEPYVQALLGGEARVITGLLPATRSHPPLVATGRPVRSMRGELRGVVLATLAPEQIGVLFAESGVDGPVVQVYDRAGRIVYSSADSAAPYEQRSAASSPSVQAALGGQSATIRARDADAFATLGGGSQVASFAAAPATGWAVSVSRDADAVRSPVRVMFERQIISQAWALLGALLLVVVLSRAIARPLLRLAAKARALGQGEPLDLSAEGGPVEVRTLAAALEGMAEDIESRIAERDAAVAVRDQFVSIAAHELKTPLTTLKATIQLSQRQMARIAGGAQVSSTLSLADAQVDRLTRLVQELLDGSRVEAGQLAIERRPVALGPLVRRVIELERTVDPGRSIELVEPDPSPVISLDAGRMEQVLLNLLENARKYSASHTPIHVSVWTTEESVAISVRDRGAGIPAEQQAQIFERFYRTPDATRAVPGLGLGLYIVHEIVRAHGGELTVSSAPRRGSTFTVLIPNEPPAPVG